MQSKVYIIALIGKAGSGKTFFYNKLHDKIEKTYNELNTNIDLVVRLPFAGIVKLLVYKYFGLAFEKDKDLLRNELRKFLFNYDKNLYDIFYDNNDKHICIYNFNEELTYQLYKLEDFEQILKTKINTFLKTQISNFLINLYNILSLYNHEGLLSYLLYLTIGKDIKDGVIGFDINKVYDYEKHIKNERDYNIVKYELYVNYIKAFYNVSNSDIREASIRKFLQLFATEYARNLIDVNIWLMCHLNLVYSLLKKKNNGLHTVVVIDDVRFLNEYEWIKQFYSKFIAEKTFFLGFTSDKVQHESGVHSHVSEMEVSSILNKEFEGIIIKNDYKEDSFDNIIDTLITEISS